MKCLSSNMTRLHFFLFLIFMYCQFDTYSGAIYTIFQRLLVKDFYTPPHKKWQGIMLYHPKILKFWVSVHLSIHPSVIALFPDSNLRSFWSIFFKLCMDIDIGKEWFGIAIGLNLLIETELWPLTDFLQTLHGHWYQVGVVWDCKWAKFVYKQQSYGPWFMCFSPQYLQNKWMNFGKILFMHW